MDQKQETNDQDYFADSIGTFTDIDFGKLITRTATGDAYAVPTTCMEAYAIALHKIRQRYPDAEVYCFTLLQRPGFTPLSVLSFHAELSKLAKYYGVYVVDLFRCGVVTAEEGYDVLMGDYVHPNAMGMDAITGAFVDSLLTNSRYVSQDLKLYSAPNNQVQMPMKKLEKSNKKCNNTYAGVYIQINTVENQPGGAYTYGKTDYECNCVYVLRRYC